MAKPRLQELYNAKILPQLVKDFQLENVMEAPKLSKIVLNIGAKEAVGDAKALNKISEVLGIIAGQKTVRTKAKKSIAGFKLREGMPIGVKVTLRGQNMYEFLDRLINLALPKVRDFQGVPTKLDRRGNYNLGIRDWSIFPEVHHELTDKAVGMNITFQTNKESDELALAMLKGFGMPFVKSTKAA